MHVRVVPLIAALIISLAACTQAADFRSLFDGKSLDGWHKIGGGEWKVVDGAIIGTNVASEGRHGHLVTDDQYGDFTIRCKYKAIKGNSGLYFRIEKVDGPVGVKGFQAEIDAANDIGGLYETFCRAWVVQPKPEDVKKYFKPGDWNEMTVMAKGKNVIVEVNGVKTAELNDDPGRLTGFIAFQLHGGQDVKVFLKDIEIDGQPVEK